MPDPRWGCHHGITRVGDEPHHPPRWKMNRVSWRFSGQGTGDPVDKIIQLKILVELYKILY